MILTERDLLRLKGVHPDLVRVVLHAATLCPIQFMVIEGLRTIEKQREYFAVGKSKTMRSRHLDGHAVDLAPILDVDGDGDTELSWRVQDFTPVAIAMKNASKAENVPIEWGGSWLTFKDAPHFQLPWEFYP